MNDQSRSVPGDAPLTRRELRERELAAIAEREAAARLEQQRAAERRATLERLARERSAARAAAPAPTPVVPTQAAPARTPLFPAQPATGRPESVSRHEQVSRPEPVSRRSMREDAAGPPTVVRPPAGAAGTRAVDATGRLMPVQPSSAPPLDASAPPVARPPVLRAAVPERTSARPAPAPQAPGYGTTPAPADPRAARPALHRPAEPGPAWGEPDTAGATAGFDAQAAPVAGFGAPFGPTSGAAPVSRQSITRQPVQQTAAGLATPPAGPDETMAAPWAQSIDPDGGAVAGAQAFPTAYAPAAAAPFQADPTLFGNGPVADGQAAFAVEPAPFAVAGVPPWDAALAGTEPGVDAFGAEDQYDAEDDEPHHAYTWLHYLILVAVAFVLGLLIWELVLGPRGGEVGAQHSGIGVTQLAAARTPTTQGDL
jgi:hypothetical protein